jgi:hypothetical protein
VKHGCQPRNYQLCVKLPTLIILAFLPLLLLCPAILQAKPMSSGQAEKIVNGWLKLDPNPLRTQLGNQVRQVDIFADDKGEPIYYVIYLKPAGFVITPADDLVEPIIAFADDGTYDPSPDNPLGALVSRDLPGRIAAARDFQAVAGSSQQKKKLTEQQMAIEKTCLEAQGKWAEMQEYSDMVGVMSVPSDVRVAPLLLSKWSQSTECGAACYNYYTPGSSYPPIIPGSTSNYVCGCVATAMAQYMRYWQYPTTGVGTGCFEIYVDTNSQTACLRGGNGSGGPYSWSDMVLDPGCSTTLTQRQAIGALTYDAGVAAHMQYSSGGSGASMYDAMVALTTTFSYTNGRLGGDFNPIPADGRNGMINPNLDWGNPALLGISRSGSSGGHAIVADGYGYDVTTLYHHLNYGWAGTNDAWYNLPNINNYDVVDNIVYNIYISGSGEIISGRVTDTLGNPISGATVTGVRTGGGTYNDTTDSNGIYALAKVPSNSTYTISVTKTGYAFTNQNVSTGNSTNFSNTTGNKWGINFVGTGTAPSPPIANPSTISATQGVAKTIDLQASDDGLPNPPGVMTYIITSLPSHGLLSDPATGVIRNVPCTLAGNDNQVVYTPCVIYTGSDSFNFKANDGGTPPGGGDSNIATITINVQLPAPTVIYETNFNGGLPSGWTIIDYLSDGNTWTTTNYYLEQVAGWTGTTYMVVGYEFVGANMNEQLITRSIDCSGLEDVKLSFKHILKHYSSETADVDIRVNNGAWQNLLRYSTSGEYTITGVVERDLSSIADGQPNVQIRWRYYNADWEWYWGIDDVKILASAAPPEPMLGDFEPDCDVDFYDFAVFASAWLSSSGKSNWNPDCDISSPKDNKIDWKDLKVFTENWLMGL